MLDNHCAAEQEDFSVFVCVLLCKAFSVSPDVLNAHWVPDLKASSLGPREEFAPNVLESEAFLATVSECLSITPFSSYSHLGISEIAEQVIVKGNNDAGRVIVMTSLYFC
ncbi:hypothetical protein PHYPO_G00004690 [Pangasianodon hypophthalmus]|uniref:Uncharacterized protein n=1 Tax=Pangasianodon hypophthalmus TaxID=310915 RepID=A0A5N5Q6D5_PANHP|nr:hypothetical protein PHYPO_G00004690 [Pangasianodon hypophthalmus]